MRPQEKTAFLYGRQTPLYYYDMDLLRATLDECSRQAGRFGYSVHYAVKANAEPRILQTISSYGFGSDCVSGAEVMLSARNGFAPDRIFFAGVGKTDKEMLDALKIGVGLFNCESVPEIRVLDALAGRLGRKADIAIRINPDIDAHTHKYISTGREEDKFGISPWAFDAVMETITSCKNLKLKGLHFHVGSQITDSSVFELLCTRVNELQQWFRERNIAVEKVDLGGGLGIDYRNPDGNPIPDFEGLFSTVNRCLKPFPGQSVHFEPGRALVAQCGTLISRVLFVKEGLRRKFLILDAGMNDLIRPALYGAYHHIENMTSNGRPLRYDVVGPVCESSDCWGKGRLVASACRGDLIAIRSAGAYGQTMAMRYNQKPLAPALFSDEI